MIDMNKIWIVDLEAVESRYTGEWKTHIPQILGIESLIHNKYEIGIIDGPDDIPEATTPGAFLNFGGTNIYKSAQMEKISRLFCEGKIKTGDHFIYTDAWNPTIVQLKYMSQLLNIPIMIHGFWHAGNYDKNDFLGRFRKNFGYKEIELFRTGWPMEYLEETFTPGEKKDVILFPHRIAPEKQLNIFKDLAKQLPEYEFIVCQEFNFTKPQYHKLLESAKIVFSANLQETLGISCYEGALAGALPMVPDRLSYSEMYSEDFKYPSEWTKSWSSYKKHRQLLVNEIKIWMTRYDDIIKSKKLNKLTTFLHENYFSCNGLKRVLFDGE
jgi:hypothetical protein